MRSMFSVMNVTRKGVVLGHWQGESTVTWQGGIGRVCWSSSVAVILNGVNGLQGKEEGK